MSYEKPVIPVIAAPSGFNKAVQSLQVELYNGLSWLEKSFGRAYMFRERDINGNASNTPKCYDGAGEYINVLPNDMFSAMSFIIPTDGEIIIDGNKWILSKTRACSLIFWVDLSRLIPGKDYVFTEELKTEVQAVLKANPYVFQINKYFDDRAENIYAGMDIDFKGRYREKKKGTYSNAAQVGEQYLMFPYAGMRFDIVFAYPDNCIAPPIPDYLTDEFGAIITDEFNEPILL